MINQLFGIMDWRKRYRNRRSSANSSQTRTFESKTKSLNIGQRKDTARKINIENNNLMARL